MTESEFTTFQIDKKTLNLLKDLAVGDRRTTPNELRWLIDQELGRRQQMPLPSPIQEVQVQS